MSHITFTIDNPREKIADLAHIISFMGEAFLQDEQSEMSASSVRGLNILLDLVYSSLCDANKDIDKMVNENRDYKNIEPLLIELLKDSVIKEKFSVEKIRSLEKCIGQ